ncbi:MarR family winged helix-turn-helix transcriptional regulator [Leeuwenhoekiella sp. NPDC079379]|uniref:MarR family winged helix-turn-helix transcriptional regulator n=1 Tax=Leeuwenhoekiella sp. NPDC079379 TaxID=3364122 RepID=UPI0037C5E50A
MQHIYDPNFQNQNLSVRTTAAFDKLADAFRILAWKGQKQSGFSPLQLKLLLFIAYHEVKDNTVSRLVNEFQITKATVSDCIKTLEKQGLLLKVLNFRDNRRFHIELTEKGNKHVSEIQEYTTPVLNILNDEKTENLEAIYNSLFSILSKLNSQNTIQLNRSCANCTAYRSDGINHAFCMQLRVQLKPKDRRIDCPKHQSK